VNAICAEEDLPTDQRRVDRPAAGDGLFSRGERLDAAAERFTRTLPR
jgi:hypothetical protein